MKGRCTLSVRKHRPYHREDHEIEQGWRTRADYGLSWRRELVADWRSQHPNQNTPPRPTGPIRTLPQSPGGATASPATDGEVSAPRQRRFRTWHFPRSACVMLETRLIEGMLLGRSAECCRSHQQRCTGLQRCNSNSYPAKFNHEGKYTKCEIFWSSCLSARRSRLSPCLGQTTRLELGSGISKNPSPRHQRQTQS